MRQGNVAASVVSQCQATSILQSSARLAKHNNLIQMNVCTGIPKDSSSCAHWVQELLRHALQRPRSKSVPDLSEAELMFQENVLRSSGLICDDSSLLYHVLSSDSVSCFCHLVCVQFPSLRQWHLALLCHWRGVATI